MIRATKAMSILSALGLVIAGSTGMSMGAKAQDMRVEIIPAKPTIHTETQMVPTGNPQPMAPYHASPVAPQPQLQEEPIPNGPFSIEKLQYQTSFFNQGAYAARHAQIALLLPLSGSRQELGKSMFDAAQLALFDINRLDISLFPYDTKGTESGAINAAVQAKNEGSHVVIGPIFNFNTKAITPTFHGAGIPVLSFTSDTSVAVNGVYALGFNPKQQIKRVVNYAIDRGYTEFAAFVPGDPYGNMIIQELQQSAFPRQAKVIRTEFYTSEPKVMETNFERLAKSLKKHEKVALLVPVGGEELIRIADLVDKYIKNKDAIQILGSGQWDTQESIQHPMLRGAWFASADPIRFRNFRARFRQTYGYEPQRLSSLAYDAVALAFTVSKREDGKQLLVSSQGFTGVDGIFRLLPTGVAERGLAVLEVKEVGNQVIDMQPTAFLSYYNR